MAYESESRLLENQKLVEDWLSDYMDGILPVGKLAEAMGYSLLSGGKRIRPVLTLEACRFCGGDAALALPFACGLEMVHTYSLIHDDLPCMDDDDLRRGKPTNHKVFGQATAVLAGDALLTSAFEVVATAPGLSAEQLVKAVTCLSQAAGPAGMVAGQVLDMDGSGHRLTLKQIQQIESLKTGAIMVAAVELGCIAAGARDERVAALKRYAEKLGLAFQIQDDILDVQGDEAEVGKPIGSDAGNQKATFISLKGIDACREMVQELTREAIASVKPYKESTFLCWLAKMLAERSK